MSQIDKKLAELGITLPAPAKPVANYVGWVRTGNLVYTAGQVTLKDGKIEYQGKVGKDFTVEEGAKAARLCAINVIAQLKDACGGDLDRSSASSSSSASSMARPTSPIIRKWSMAPPT